MQLGQQDVSGISFSRHKKEVADSTRLPIELLDTGTNADVLRYARSLRDQAVSKIFRCKLMLLGPGAAGKSTLVHRLVQGGFNGELTYTDGLCTTDWTVRTHLPPCH